MKHILTIAGSDPCAGAGIQADLKTISALGAYGLSVITAVTAQNTRGVTGVQEIKPEIIRAQLEAVFADVRVDAVKIGMLGSSATIQVVAAFLRDLMADKLQDMPVNYETGRLPLVLDPVMVAKSGDRLLEDEAVNSLINDLLPMAMVLTPNLPEAQTLLGSTIKDPAEMAEAGKKLVEMGPKWVVVKGGHLPGEPIDLVVGSDEVYELPGRRVAGHNNHGTGCTYSSAIATYLALGHPVPEAIRKAKGYVEASLVNGFSIGHGVGVLDHFTGVRSAMK